MSGEGLQKLNLKLHVDAPAGLDVDLLLAVFGRWRLEQGEEIVDLADYAHVDRGPGCLLISHRWHFGLDLAGGKPGLFYSTRKGLSGSPAERIAQALRGLVEKSRRLVAEPEWPRAARARCGELELVLNDRLVAPNSDAVDAVWRPALDGVLAKVYGAGARVEREKDPARRLGYAVHAAAGDGLTLEQMAARLGG